MPAIDAPIPTAELLAIGTELTVGETIDTNSGEIARSLAELGVRVRRVTALPDALETIRDGFAAGLAGGDLVVSTGGLGPTPDDLTREAIAALCGEVPAVDPELEAWLRGLFARRGVEFPAGNLKQAWRIPSAVAIPNEHGTAPGWWVERDGAVVVALPGPPREMRPMWAGWVLPRLRSRGLGREVAVRTFRLTGIGESVVADRLGEALLRSANPSVATYARSEAVDVRIAARPEPASAAGPPRSAPEILAATAAVVLDRLGRHVWAEGATTWAEAIDTALAERGWRLSTVELGTRGALAGLLGRAEALGYAEVRAALDAATRETGDDRPGDQSPAADLLALAEAARTAGASEVGLALRARPRAGDTVATVALVTPDGDHTERRLAFLTGELGNHRAAIAAAQVLLTRLRAGGRPAGG